MKIRPIRIQERAIWESLFNEYAQFYKTQVPAGGHETVWNWIFDDTNDFWCDVVVADSDEPFGFTQYQLMHRSLGGSMVCYLSDLYVQPGMRCQSAGKGLIDHVIGFARRREISNVRWLTQDFNYRGRHLYDKYCDKSDFILYSLPV